MQSSFSGIIVDGALFNVDANNDPLSTPLDQSGTVVRNNVVETRNGQHIHVALAMGTHLWCSDLENNPDCGYGSNGHAENNQLSGTFGWGIFVDGMVNATVIGNSLLMSEWLPIQCYVPGQQEMVLEDGGASIVLAQSDFVTRDGVHFPCLDGTAE